jgi:diaminohydroxyphosphoribosylaminopyrimidine deaminase/5-amino-6-(5-phosphoribosylamino)uracil reductase
MKNLDQRLMQLALDEAVRGLGATLPNPMVGAVIHSGGQVIATGHHARVGAPHAEADALAFAGERARGASMVVTLEPCSRHGRTPPCTDAILAAGISDLTVGMLDPNPREAGRGVDILREAGIEVRVGVLEDACRELNRAYIHYITTRRPYVTLKLAATMDGRIATRTGHSQWVSGPPAQELSHRLRAEADAILIGRRTAELDNPALTCRLVPHKKQPLRVILDPGLTLAPRLSVFQTAETHPTVVFCREDAGAVKAAEIEGLGVRVERVAGEDHEVYLDQVLQRLGELEVAHLIVEGGGQVAATFLSRRLVGELVLVLAPKLVGGDGIPLAGPLGIDRMDQALGLDVCSVEPLGDDWVVRARPIYPADA